MSGLMVMGTVLLVKELADGGERRRGHETRGDVENLQLDQGSSQDYRRRGARHHPGANSASGQI